MKKLMVVLAMIAGTVLIGISPASAHANAVTGQAVCNTDTGKFDVSWTITNDYGLTETATSRLGTVDIAKEGSATQTETVEAGTYTLSVAGVWTDGFTEDASGSVTAQGTCEKPVVKPPNPGDKVVQNADTEEAANCETKTVVIHHSQTTTPSVYDEASNTYVPGKSVTEKLPDTTRDATDTECVPPVVPPKFDSYKTTVCWEMHGTANDEGYSWPQTRVSCDVVPKCEETIAIQKDVYLIENAEEEAYLAGMNSMTSSADDHQIIDSWSLVTRTGDECEVDVPPVDVPPVVTPPVVVPPVVTPPVVVTPVVTPPAIVKVATVPTVVKIVTPPTTVKQITSPAAQEQGVLPNTGGSNVLLPTIAVLLIAIGGSVVYFARKVRNQN